MLDNEVFSVVPLQVWTLHLSKCYSIRNIPCTLMKSKSNCSPATVWKCQYPPSMYSVLTSFYPQGYLRKSTGVRWPSTCSVYEPYGRSCNWSRDAHVWWQGTQRWENIKQVDGLVSVRIEMHMAEVFCVGEVILYTAYPYPWWHHCAQYCWRVSN